MILANHGIISSSGASLPLLLDTYSGATGAYSLRKLRTAYNDGAIIVRRSSDNTSQSIGFKANGTLDTTTLLSFVGSGNGFVTLWANQDGNSNHYLFNNTLSSQPQIVENGSVITDASGNPTIRFTNQKLSLAYGSNWNATNSSLFYNAQVINNLNSNYSGLLNMGDGSNYESRLNVVNPLATNKFFIYWNGTYQVNTDIVAGSQTRKIYTQIFNGNLNVNLWSNNTLIGSGSKAPGTINSLAEFSVGGYNTTSGYQNGYLSEIIYYNADQTSNRTNIETNINSFYSIY